MRLREGRDPPINQLREIVGREVELSLMWGVDENEGDAEEVYSWR